MRGTANRSIERVREDIPFHQFRHVGVETIDVGDPAAEHDHVGVYHRDEHRQSTRETIFVSLHRRLALERRTGKKGFDARVLAAIAARTGNFFRRAPWKLQVSPLACDGVRTVVYATIDRNTAA